MLQRVALRRQLDSAVLQSRVTLLLGLPRVGRSELLRSWLESRNDAAICRSVNDFAGDAAFVAFDHCDYRDVDPFVARVRATEANRKQTRFIVVPIDLLTAARIRDSLAGSVQVFDVMPLQLDDIAGNLLLQRAASGPSANQPRATDPTSMPVAEFENHWLRGGLPESFASESDTASLRWRRTMVHALLARDYSRWDIPRAFPLVEALHWIAKQNGGELDETRCPFANRTELRSAVFILDQLGVVRQLRNFAVDSSVSLAKKQKIFVRDSGVLHAMLGIETLVQLRAHKDIGASWETYAIEALILAAGERCRAQFFRAKESHGEDEIDLVLDFPFSGGRLVAIEFKVGPNQRARSGFYRGCTTIGASDRFVVHSGTESYSGHPVDRLDLKNALQRVKKIAFDG